MLPVITIQALEFIIEKINNIKNILENNLAYHTKYVPYLLAKYCIEEFDFYLEFNKLEQCFYDIYEELNQIIVKTIII